MNTKSNEQQIKRAQLKRLTEMRSQFYSSLDKQRRGEPLHIAESVFTYTVFFPGSERYGYGSSEFHRKIESVETSDVHGSRGRLDEGFVHVNGKRKVACNIFNNKTRTWVRLDYKQLVSDQESCWAVFGVDGAEVFRARRDDVHRFSHRVDRRNIRFADRPICLDPQ